MLLASVSPRLALWIVLAMLVVATPLAEIWRRHGSELQAVLDARDALRPVAQATHAQRSLLAHRPYAAAVLAGRQEMEAERQRRQIAVDTDLATLLATLERQRHDRALDEVDLLREGWSALLEGIGRRRLAVAASDTAHDLLIEQVFVVLDLVAARSGLRAQTGRGFAVDDAALVLDALPRFTVMAMAMSRAAPGAAAAETTHPSAQAGRVARAAAARLAALSAMGADAPSPDPKLLQALAALERHAAALAAAGAGDPATAQRAHAAADDAGRALVAQLDADLATTAVALQRERWLLGVATAMALLIAALAAVRVVPRAAPADGVGAEDIEAPGERIVRGPGSDGHTRPLPIEGWAPGGAESGGPTSDLLRRLRRGEVDGARTGAGDLTGPGPLGPSSRH
ncbi:MAG: hypothetical protein KIT17_03410 [Rubrivivax sp.]|nr:hypothetical protein [Rubrivivax sp.]